MKTGLSIAAVFMCAALAGCSGANRSEPQVLLPITQTAQGFVYNGVTYAPRDGVKRPLAIFRNDISDCAGQMRMIHQENQKRMAQLSKLYGQRMNEKQLQMLEDMSVIVCMTGAMPGDEAMAQQHPQTNKGWRVVAMDSDIVR